VEAINAQVLAADSIIQPLKDRGLMTTAPFDFVYFEKEAPPPQRARRGLRHPPVAQRSAAPV